jgi:hypothetical protein
MGNDFSKMSGAASIAAFMAFACHSPIHVPCGTDCAGGMGGEATAGSGVAAGAPSGGAMTAEAGAGGDAPSRAPAGGAMECAADEDCGDDVACNGDESCKAGRCEPGRAVKCPAVTECVEAAPPGCQLKKERFVIYAGDEFSDNWRSAVGVSLSSLTELAQLDFSQGAMDEVFKYLGGCEWSPNGRRLVFTADAEDFANNVSEQKYFWFDVDAPIADQPRRLPDIPITDGLRLMSWSASQDLLIIGRKPSFYGEASAWLYVVRFGDTGAETTVLPENTRAFVCADDETVAYETIEGTHLTSIADTSAAGSILPARLVGISPDGKWLLLSDDSHAYLAPCDRDTALETLGGPAGLVSGWSEDSRYVVYSDTDRDPQEEPKPKALSAYRVNDEQPRSALFEAMAADPEVSFEPGSARFLYAAQALTLDPVWRVRDLDRPNADSILSLPEDIGDPNDQKLIKYVHWMGTTGSVHSAGFLQPVAPGAEPRLLYSEFDLSELRISDDGTKAIWIQKQGSDPELNEVYSLDLTNPSAKPKSLLNQPISGPLVFGGEQEARILVRWLETPATHADVWAVPEDFESPLVQINTGNFADRFVVQPRR